MINTSITPDYAVTEEKLYRDVVLSWWRELGNTNFLLWTGLRYSSTSWKDESQPSWVPDWKSSQKPLQDGPLPNAYECSAGSHVSGSPVFPPESPSVLLLPGLLADEVILTSCALGHDDRRQTVYELFIWAADRIAKGEVMVPATQTHILHEIFKMAFMRHRKRFVSTTIPAEDAAELLEFGVAFSLMLLTDRPTDRTLEEGELLTQKVENRLNRLQLCSVTDLIAACVGKEIVKHVRVPQCQFDITELLETLDPTWLVLYQNVIEHITGRKLFLTKKGYLALSTSAEDVAVADRVAIIAKCEMPIILRGQAKFRVAGPAFIAEFMDGEIGDVRTELLEIE